MTHLARLAGRLFNEPLLVTQSYLDVALTAIHDRLDIEPIIENLAAADYTRPAREMVIDSQRGVAIVPIVGALDHRGGGISSMSGMASYTGVQAALKAAANTRGVRALILDVDSPGGSVSGVTETAEYITQLAGEMPVYAIANGLMASAAFWLCSGATRIYAAPMANVGSVGVVVAHQDQSQAMEKRGVVVTHIHAGARKVDGNPYGPLSETARADIQSRIDAVYGQFVSAIATNRGITAEAVRATEAGVFGPEQALELGFIDGIGTLSDVLGAMNSRINTSQFTGFSAKKDDTMTERLAFSQQDIDAAIARATSEASSANASAISTAVAKATAEIATAATALAPGHDRLSAFFEALNDGASVALSAKMAGRIPAPTAAASVVPAEPGARAADVDRVFKAAAPGIEAEGSGNVDPKTARREQLTLAAKGASGMAYTGGRA